MLDEEDERKRPKKLVDPIVMEPLSIEELQQLIGHFEAEIVRAKEEIGRKKYLLGSAEELFKK